MSIDLSWRITVEHGSVTVVATLGDADIHEVVEALDYALRGAGFDPEVIRRGFGQYAEP